MGEEGYFKKHNINAWIIFYLLIYLVLIMKIVTYHSLSNSLLFGLYSALVSAYILSRFFISYFYNPVIPTDTTYQPTVSFVTPAKDEGEHIAQTLRAMLNSDYPKEKFEIIAINDGSSDKTYDEMLKVKKEAQLMGVKMRVVNWTVNRGKREGMAKGVMLSQNEIVLFVDSDSFIKENTMKELVKYFNDPEIAAVAGHADVHNSHVNLLTKMQTVRYFVSFKAYKASEAIFGSVVCCSGCCSAYRRSAVMEVLHPWQYQTFLGASCTYGDDRSLTNYLVKKYKTIYAPEAQCTTIVPEKWNQFFKQQLRWKKSWTRESFIAARFMWKKNPIMVVSFFLGLILPLLAPLIVFRVLFWLPSTENIFPIAYLLGLILMSGVYGVYYYIYNRNNLWFYGTIFAWFYSLILIWQLPYAILTLRDSKWGTR